jgi:hypothetical protein
MPQIENDFVEGQRAAHPAFLQRFRDRASDISRRASQTYVHVPSTPHDGNTRSGSLTRPMNLEKSGAICRRRHIAAFL